jgi:hypothetical protein
VILAPVLLSQTAAPAQSRLPSLDYLR